MPSRRGKLSGVSANGKRGLATAKALHLRASRLAAQGDYRSAAAALLQALPVAEQIRPSQPVFIAAILNDFGVVCKYTGRFAQASRMYRRALKLVAASRDRWERKRFEAALYHNLGGVEYSRRRFDLALRYARRGIRLRKTIRPREATEIAADEAALAAILSEVGRTSDAVAIYSRVLRVFRRNLGREHYEVGAALANLGAVYWRIGRSNASERALQRAVEILEEALGRKHPRTITAVNNLAIIRARRSRTK